jgi:hypothetical protein
MLEQLSEILRTLVEDHGFGMPIYVAMIGLNGSSAIGRYDQEGDHLGFEMLSQSVKGGTFGLPINVMLVDGTTGNAARVLLSKDNKPQYFLH